MAEYIKKEDVIQSIRKKVYALSEPADVRYGLYVSLVDPIERMPTIKAEEKRDAVAEFMFTDRHNTIIPEVHRCSNCGGFFFSALVGQYDYCPWCRAKFIKVKSEEVKKPSAKDLALELLTKYEQSERSLIWEYSAHIEESEDKLADEIQEYKKLIEEAEG